jgi:hypothetical protein
MSAALELRRVMIERPPHYTSGGIEVIDAILAWGLDYCLGNVVKYVARAGKKDASVMIEDLMKAREYLNREIHRLEKEELSV